MELLLIKSFSTIETKTSHISIFNLEIVDELLRRGYVCVLIAWLTYIRLSTIRVVVLLIFLKFSISVGQNYTENKLSYL